METQCEIIKFSNAKIKRRPDVATTLNLQQQFEEGKMEDNQGVSYDLLTYNDVDGFDKELIMSNIQIDENICVRNGTERRQVDPKEDETVERLEKRSKPKSVKDILPVLVAVWSKMSPEIRSAYKIFRELLDDKLKCTLEPFVDDVDAEEFADYYDVIKEPMNLFRISEKFHNMEYESITDVIADIRQIIENCFKYNGVDSFISKQAQKLEVILEQKLNLLSRELRSKTTIAATNKARNREYLNSLIFTSGGRRLTQKHKNGETSLIAMQIHLQEELEGKERKRLKHKEKKELNSALEEECEKWTKETLNESMMAEVKCCWEIPSVGIFICILKDFLNLQDFNYSEFEIGMLFPRESSLLTRIFTSLLVTSFQRKRLNNKEPMKYVVWSEKVKSRIVSWYKIASTHGQEYSASLYGFDADIFEVLGYVNPFQDSEFHELPLKSRAWILKALCEVALEQDSIMRDYFGELELIDRQDVCLGFDSDGFSYHYISHFGATDIRVYKQRIVLDPGLPKLRDQQIMMEKDEPNNKDEDAKNIANEEEKIESATKVEEVVEKDDESSKALIRTSKRIRTKRSLSPTTPKATPPKKEKKVARGMCKDFQVVADDIASLKELHDKFEKCKKEKGNRKQAEKELQQSFDALYVELKKREINFIKSNQKARLKIMIECKEWEKKAKSEDEKKMATGWDSENDEDDDDMDEKIVENSPKSTSENTTSALNEAQDVELSRGFFSPEGAARNDIVTLTKEGRKLRSKRFDVKDLFGEATQPPYKRTRSDKIKHDLNEDGNVWREDSDDDAYEPDESSNVPNQCRQRKKSMQKLRRRQTTRDDEISDRDIKMLREKRLERIKQDLKEGKMLTAEEQRNLMHLGLSSHEIEELKKLQKNNPEFDHLCARSKLKEETRMDSDKKSSRENVFKIDSSKLCLSYDGLKALADVATLAQQTSPEKESKKLQVIKTSTDQVNLIGNAASLFGKSVNKPDGANLILVGNHKGKGNASPLIYVIEGKEDNSGQGIQVNNSKKLITTSKASGQVKNIIIQEKVSKITKNEQGIDRIISTSSPKTSSCISSALDKGSGTPMILQRKRPNILRKPATNTSLSVQAEVIGSKETNFKFGLKGGNDKRQDIKPPFANSEPLGATQMTRTLSVIQSGPISVTDGSLVASSMGQIPGSSQGQGQGQTGGRVIGQVDKIIKQNFALVSKQTQVQKQHLNMNTVKHIVNGCAQSSQSNSATGPVLIVTQGSRVIGQNGVPLILASNNQHVLQGKSHDKNQPVLLLTSKQPLLQTGSLFPKQQQQKQQCVVLKQPLDTCLLTYDQQQQLHQGTPVTGQSLSETEQKASTSCPVTTLKSKLHAAALKRKHNGKNKIDLFQHSYQPITAKINAPLKIESGFTTDTSSSLSNVQSSSFTGMKTGNMVETSGQRKAISIIKQPPKIAPKTVHIVKSNVSIPATITYQTIQDKDIKISPVQVSCSDFTPVSGIIASSSSRNVIRDVNTIMSSAKAVAVADQLNSVTGLKNVQIVKKVNTPVNATDADKTVFFTSWSNAYVPKKSRLSSPQQKQVISMPGKRSTFQPIKPAISSLNQNVSAISQATSQILIAPAAYQRTISLPAQIVQLPAQIPSKQEVTGAAESNRGVATAAQLVIVPQTRAPKQIRPAIDSTTAVKALKSLEQVMKPMAAVDSLLSSDVRNTNEATDASNELSSSNLVELQADDPKSSRISPRTITESTQNEPNASPVLIASNQDVVSSSSTVKDKSSVTYSTLSPIPCAEIQASVSETSTLNEVDTKL